MKIEKYGFVYIWRDKKYNRYYVGCHWGTENDGYICSSKKLKIIYNNRPQDFKRRIIARIYTNRKDMLDEEFKWLSLIKEEEFDDKYYNLNNRYHAHWSCDETKKQIISNIISKKTKEAMNNPEIREKYLEGLKNRNTRSSDLEVREKRRQSMIDKNVGKDNSKARKMGADANRGKKLSLEHIQKVKEKTHFKVLNSQIVKCEHCGKEGNPGNIGRYHNSKCKVI